MQAPRISRYLILHEYRLAGNQRSAVHLAAGLADHLQIGPEGRGNLRAELAKVPQLRGQLHCQIVMLVSGIPDENTCQYLPNLLPGGMRVLIQQPCQHQRCRRCIVRTLYNTGGYHSLLHIVQFSPLHQGLRRANLRPFSLIQQDKVCIAQLAVKNNGI